MPGCCAGEMKLKGAQIEHVVPKVFAVFDVRKGGKAEPGTRYTSRLHKIDNLQAAHTYCNRRSWHNRKFSTLACWSAFFTRRKPAVRCASSQTSTDSSGASGASSASAIRLALW